MNIDAKIARALKLHRDGSFIKAEKLYNTIIEEDPNNFDVLHLLAMLISDKGDNIKAIGMLDKCIAIKPDFIIAKTNKARVLLRDAKPQEALQILNEIKFKYAFDPEIHFISAQAYSTIGLEDKAIAELCLYIDLKPNDFNGHFNLGCIYQKRLNFSLAVTAFNKAINISKNSADAYMNLGVSLAQLGRLKEAIQAFQYCLQMNPKSSSAYTNIGFALKEQGKYDDAVEAFNKAITINENMAEAYAGIGYTLQAKKIFKEAVISLEKAYDLFPKQDYLLGKLLHSKLHICEWLQYDELYKNLLEGIANNERVCTPFTAITICDSPQIHLEATKVFVQSQELSVKKTNIYSANITRNSLINIGYFSADFYNHATSYLIAEVFENHDQTKFNISAFLLSNRHNDEMTKRISSSVNNFFDVAEYTDEEISKFARDKRLDIAIDLKGYTEGARPKVFTYGCAPLQVNYLGYPGTLASEVYDYIIVDEVVVPNNQQDYYAEKLAYMPSCYQPNDKFRKISNHKPRREDLELPNNSFIFGSFNNNYKIQPHLLDIWCQILKSVKNSILWIYVDSNIAAENLLNEVFKRGIHKKRINFAYKMPLPEHLARISCADLMLDTFPCCGHTTTSDALWAGLPVLTKIGQSFSARVSASLLKEMDLSELIAHTEEDYINMAIYYAQNFDKLIEIRKKIGNNKVKSRLFNNKVYTKNLENLYISFLRADRDADYI